MTLKELLNMVDDKSAKKRNEFVTVFFQEVAKRDEDDQTIANEIYSQMFGSGETRLGVQDFTKSGSMR